MSNLLLTGFLFLCAFFGRPSQQTETLKIGIYQSYSEFKANNPSITEVEIVLKKPKDEHIFTKKEVSFKKLPKALQGKGLLRNCWGFSDGKQVFINNWPIFQEFSYSPLVSIGRYCPFFGKENLRQSTSGSVGSIISLEAPKQAYVFDREKGASFVLDEKMLFQILEDRNDLIHKYQQERDKENPRTKIWYVTAVN